MSRKPTYRPGINVLEVNGRQWRTPLTDLPAQTVGNARLAHDTYERGYYAMEDVDGYYAYRVHGARLRLTTLMRRAPVGLQHSAVDGEWMMWMLDDPLHWYGMRERVRQLQPGRLLVAGLGLGLMLHHLAAERPDITSIEVVEWDADVVALIWPTLPALPDLRITHGDYYARVEALGAGPRSEWPDSILWDLAVGGQAETAADLARARATRDAFLPGVPLHRFGLRGPDVAATPSGAWTQEDEDYAVDHGISYRGQ